MVNTYKVPPKTRIGHVHLKVSDLEKSLSFYRDLLGFEITERLGNQAVFLSAGDYHHHIALNTWNSAGAGKALRNGVGLYHAAILYDSRAALAEITKRLMDSNYPLTGAADHGVSEAIYLDDPDGNGIELYWDKPRQDWPKKEDGSIHMYTHHLDLEDLFSMLF